MGFICMKIKKNHFHINGFLSSLALKQSHGATRRWHPTQKFFPVASSLKTWDRRDITPEMRLTGAYTSNSRLLFFLYSMSSSLVSDANFLLFHNGKVCKSAASYQLSYFITGNKKPVISFATLRQNELNGDVARFITHLRTCLTCNKSGCKVLLT